MNYLITWTVVYCFFTANPENEQSVAYPFELIRTEKDTAHFYERQPAIDFYNQKISETHHITTDMNPGLYLPFQNIKIDSIQQ